MQLDFIFQLLLFEFGDKVKELLQKYYVLRGSGQAEANRNEVRLEVQAEILRFGRFSLFQCFIYDDAGGNGSIQ